MGYNAYPYIRKIGGLLTLRDPVSALPAITFPAGGGAQFKSGSASNAFRVYYGSLLVLTIDWSTGAGASTVTGASLTTNDLVLKANSIDADNITIEGTGDIVLTPTGNVKFGTHTATGDAVSNGSVEIKDIGGTTRKLMTKA